MKRHLLLTLFCVLCQCVMMAQSGMTVSGTVVDSKDIPMPGVLVEIVGRTENVRTDIDGRFKIDLPVEAKKIRVSYPGYKAMEFKIQPNMHIKLGSGWGSKASGYRGFFDIQGGFGFGGETNVVAGNMRIEDTHTLLTFGLATTHGYQINSHLFAGLGLGVYADVVTSKVFDSYPDTNSEFYALRVPLFADVRWDFGIEKKTAPYIDIKAGYQFNTVLDPDSSIAYGYIWQNSGSQHIYLYGSNAQGVFLQPSIGMRASIGGKRAVNLGLAYSICIPRRLKAKYEYPLPYDYNYGYLYESETMDLGKASGGAFILNIGFDF